MAMKILRTFPILPHYKLGPKYVDFALVSSMQRHNHVAA